MLVAMFKGDGDHVSVVTRYPEIPPVVQLDEKEHKKQKMGQLRKQNLRAESAIESLCR